MLKGFVCVAVQVKSGTILHGAVTTIVLQISLMQGVLLAPVYLIMRKQTVYVPGAVYVCTGFSRLEALPSPNVQRIESVTAVLVLVL